MQGLGEPAGAPGGVDSFFWGPLVRTSYLNLFRTTGAAIFLIKEAVRLVDYHGTATLPSDLGDRRQSSLLPTTPDFRL